ncbi:envelope stress response membrane protein PspC [Erythrobacter sp. YT30]|uniref:envelope stress response membrane protein PspC n=1 Tax=Erythrobacter sp. YT30 TaxID=1735012 RepID=UPI00076C6C5B|nr:envelope stress response membrane protein PspC [Erythrobacter sp. YT30]KWV90847.1 phage shock protein C [Erythrobacter sp. YT30]
MNTPRTTLYRDQHNAKILGVCAGIAEYTGVKRFWVRAAAVFLTFATQGFALLAYVIAGFVLKKKPPHLYKDVAEQKYWQGIRQSPKRTAREIRARFRDIDRRLVDVETHYVSNNTRLTAEIERLR